MKQNRKMIIYNLFPLLAGKFTDWEPHLVRAHEMGFNWVFVNPIQYPGFSGSLYSIKDYFSFNQLLVNEESGISPEAQLKETIQKAESLGLKMMIDLVINHCAIDSDLIKEHPEWFLRKKNGKIEHPFAKENGKKVVWGDLAKFDHLHTKDPEGMYQFFFRVIEFLIDMGFHGFRCDAAYQLPRALWKRLISETKEKYPDTLFFAETLGCSPDLTRKTASAGFDYIFNSSKWWDYKGAWLLEQYNLTRDSAPSISFAESHDTIRLFKELEGNVDGVKQRYLFSSLFSAGSMMPMGLEFGFKKKLHVVKTRPKYWEKTDIDLTSFIRQVNEIKSRYSIFQEEAPTEILPSDNPKVLVMWKASTTTREEALLILNKDAENHQNYQVDRLCDLMQSKAPCTDVSPEYPLDYLPEPFTYDLRPGQGIVLVNARDNGLED
jgi:starch synthase (maltosyl-transferring)